MSRWARACCTLLFAMPMLAASPRWTMVSLGGWDGAPLPWYRTDLHYYTDAGALSQYVSHDAAEALVAAAAATWNVPQSLLTLQRGGLLAEDVSSDNVYVGADGPIWPADVQLSNNDQNNIAVILDADGTLIDMLLGSGASEPGNCRQNAVLENVDLVRDAARSFIYHAMIFLNGRCTGPSSEQQLQMQYQLMRVFGRVLGVGWSQTNDNVFTGSPMPSYTQQQHWPIMHPIDILCGTYSYQCLINPFQLRDDDLAAISLLYAVPRNAGITGKEGTLDHATLYEGSLLFPDGMGMAGVNVVVHASYPYLGYAEDWESTSSVTGYRVKDFAGNPVTGAIASAPVMFGSSDRSLAGYYKLNRIPISDAYSWQNLTLSAQPVNPLYVGAYAVGPYQTSQVSPSGTLPAAAPIQSGKYSTRKLDLASGATAMDCDAGNDGTEDAPAQVDAGGEWTGRFCGYGHTAWMSMAVKSGHTMTMEVTALDEFGNATNAKALPVMGVWHASDSSGILPTVAANTSSMNGRINGLTQLPVTLRSTEQLRLAVTEQRGEGRPDFGYRARVLYADSVMPSHLPASGGSILIRGMGFQPGNTVMVGGVAAQVQSYASSQILAIAPAQSMHGAMDVQVVDLKTGGSTAITGGVSYGAFDGEVLRIVSAPSGNIAAGEATEFGVQLLTQSGVGVSGVGIHFSSTVNGSVGGVRFECGTSCTVTTDAMGQVQVPVTAVSAGTVVLTASADGVASVTSTFQAISSVHALTASRSLQYVAAGQLVQWQPAVTALANNVAAPSLKIAWTVMDGKNPFVPTEAVTNGNGVATVQVPARLSAEETKSVQACTWETVCTVLSAQGVADSEWSVEAVEGVAQSVSSAGSFATVILRVTDAAGDGVQGVPVSVYQAVEGWQPPCTVPGRCAPPPVYGTAQTAGVTDADGLIGITPLEYGGTAAFTKVVASAGPHGYISFVLEKRP